MSHQFSRGSPLPICQNGKVLAFNPVLQNFWCRMAARWRQLCPISLEWIFSWKSVASCEPRTWVRCVESGWQMPLPKYPGWVFESPNHYFKSKWFANCIPEMAQIKHCQLSKRLPRRCWHLVPVKWSWILDTARYISRLHFFILKTHSEDPDWISGIDAFQGDRFKKPPQNNLQFIPSLEWTDTENLVAGIICRIKWRKNQPKMIPL